MNNTEEMVARAKLMALQEIYIEALREHKVPFSFCSKIKEKINALEESLKNVEVK